MWRAAATRPRDATTFDVRLQPRAKKKEENNNEKKEKEEESKTRATHSMHVVAAHPR